VQRIVDFGKDHAGLTEQRFVNRAVAEIRADGLRHFIEPLFKRVAQPLQIIHTLLVGGTVLEPGVTQALK